MTVEGRTFCYVSEAARYFKVDPARARGIRPVGDGGIVSIIAPIRCKLQAGRTLERSAMSERWAREAINPAAAIFRAGIGCRVHGVE